MLPALGGPGRPSLSWASLLITSSDVLGGGEFRRRGPLGARRPGSPGPRGADTHCSASHASPGRKEGGLAAPAMGLAFLPIFLAKVSGFPSHPWSLWLLSVAQILLRSLPNAVSRLLGEVRDCKPAGGWEVSFLASRQPLPAVLQEVWPPAVGGGRREAEEPVHPHAERGPATREGQRAPLQHPHHRAVSGRPGRAGRVDHTLQAGRAWQRGTPAVANHTAQALRLACWAGRAPFRVETVVSLVVCISWFM